MSLLFEHPWWTTLWVIIIAEGISCIGKRK
jgi:hypothetical protein